MSIKKTIGHVEFDAMDACWRLFNTLELLNLNKTSNIEEEITLGLLSRRFVLVHLKYK